jgi:hypothetical protein
LHSDKGKAIFEPYQVQVKTSIHHKNFKNMGTIKQGILGGFSGKVGTVIGASWKGINYMRSTGAGTITFDWEDNSGVGNAKQTDKALIAVINPTKSEAVYDTAGAERMTVTQEIIVPADWVGEDVEVFFGFISEDHREVANSVYLGTITIS